MSVPETAVEITNGHHAHYSSFDLETYIGRYAEGSETRLQRLAFIAQHSSDPALQHTAHQMLERQVKQAGNVIRYKQLYPEEQQQDADWIRTTTANNEAALEVLEARLSAAQANLNKDAIRIAYLNLGDHCVKVGLIRDALRHVLRARDYCTNRTQTGHICWNVIELAMNICTSVALMMWVLSSALSLTLFSTILLLLLLLLLSQPVTIKFVIMWPRQSMPLFQETTNFLRNSR